MSDKLREIVAGMTPAPWEAQIPAFMPGFDKAKIKPLKIVGKMYCHPMLFTKDAEGIVALRNNAEMMFAVIDAVRAYQKQRAEIVAASSDWCKSPSELQMDDALAVLDAKIGET